MTDWMNSKSINEIIAKNIRNHIGTPIKIGYLPSGRINLVPFDISNKRHINIVINDTISEIDSIIRFTLKNYFENYYNILEARFGSDNCGQNWSLYMEHGTTKKELIEIQKLGVPRHLSKVFLDSFGKYCKFNINRDLVALDTDAIAEILKSKQKPEYSEIALKDNYILGNAAISN